jgi:hypothetical protein
MAEIQTQNNFGSTLTGAANLAQLFLGGSGTTTTGGTTTTQDNRTQTNTTSGGTTTTTTARSVPPGAVDAVVRSILEGSQGLAAIAGGQRTAGLYNSSTNMMLSNDLIARAAGEGAKLNDSTTTTAVTSPTTSTTQLSGGTTSTQNQTQAQVKNPAINPGIALGGLALLQAIPKDIKDSVLSGLLGGKKGAAAAAAGDGAAAGNGSTAIADAYNDPSRALDLAPGSSVAADGIASVGGVAGGGQSVVDGLSIDASGGADSAITSFGGDGGDELGNFLSTNDNFAGIDSGVDYLNELGSGIGDSLGGFLSGIGQGASDFAGSIGDFFSDFDFSFADGGMVSEKSKLDQMGAHFSKKLEEYYSNNGRMSQMGGVPAFKDGGRVRAKAPGYANGGSVSKTSDVYDLDTRDLTTLPNTGLRPADLQRVITGAVAGNDQSISRMVSDSIRGSEASPRGSQIYPSGTSVRGAGQSDNRSGSNVSARAGISPESSEQPAGIGVSEGSGIGSVSGIANAIGVSPAVGQVGISGLTGLMGLAAPGLSGLANASNNNAAVNSFLAAIVGLANPVAGIVVSALLSQMNSSTPSGAGDDGDEGSTAGITVGEPGPVSVVGTVSGDDGDSGGGEGGVSAGTGDAASGGGDGAAGDGGVGGTGLANGGAVDGPGTGTSDSILARLSDGEYVIPADVVVAKGESFFDKLIAMHHKPATSRKGA